MKAVWVVHDYENKIDLFGEREDAERFVFEAKYTFLHKNLNDEKSEYLNPSDYLSDTEREISQRQCDRALEYLEHIRTTSSTWEIKNQRLYENGIVSEIEEIEESNDEDDRLGFNNFLMCRDTPSFSIEHLPIQ